MIRGTTPTIKIQIDPEELALEQVTSLLVPIVQRGEVIVLKNETEVDIDTDENSIGIFLTEEESLAFETGNAEIQLIYWVGDVKSASAIATFRVTRILYEEDRQEL